MCCVKLWRQPVLTLTCLLAKRRMPSTPHVPAGAPALRNPPSFAPPPRRWQRNDIGRNSPVPAKPSRLPRITTPAELPPPIRDQDQNPAVAERFHALAERWRKETEFASSSTSLFMNGAYQEIIGMGREALPFILKDLAETRSHWFWALRAITGVDPVEPEARGYVGRMADRWLEWGHAEGLL